MADETLTRDDRAAITGPAESSQVAPGAHEFSFAKDGYEVADVGSLNGTYVDHKRVDTAPLHHLADLQIGRFVLVFLVGSGDQ